MTAFGAPAPRESATRSRHLRWLAEEVERLVDATVATPTVPATVRVETVLQRTNRLIMLTRLETLSEFIVIGHPTLADTPRRRSVAWSTTS